MKVPRQDLDAISYLTIRAGELKTVHTPGSDVDAWMKEDTQMYIMYANMMGMAGEMLCHSHGAENTKNRMAGRTTTTPVAMLIGL